MYCGMKEGPRPQSIKESRSKAPSNLDLGTRRMVSFTFLLSYAHEEDTDTNYIGGHVYKNYFRESNPCRQTQIRTE